MTRHTTEHDPQADIRYAADCSTADCIAAYTSNLINTTLQLLLLPFQQLYLLPGLFCLLLNSSYLMLSLYVEWNRQVIVSDN